MEDHGQVVAFLKEAAELAVGVAEGRIEHMEEAELAIQLAGFKMDCEAVKTSEEIRACYRIAAEVARKAIAEIRNMPLK